MAYASDDSIAEIFDSFLKIYNDKEGWEFISEKRGVVIDRKYYGDDSLATLRGVGTVASHHSDVLKLVTDIERRKEWDLFYELGYNVKRFNEETGLGYARTKSYTMVWPRDFAVLATGRRIPEADGGGFIFVGRSVVDDELVPPDDSCVRGTVHIAGFHVRPADDNPSHSVITYIFKIDPAGWVPSSISNLVNNYQPLSIIGIRKILTGSSSHPPEAAAQ